MRWFHEAVDRLHGAVLSRLVPPVFRQGLDSPPWTAHLAATQVSLPALTARRHYTITTPTVVGTVTAGFQIRWGPRPDVPVIVYHHGIAEMPYDKSFRGICRGMLPTQAHLVAIRAPFHRTWLDVRSGLRTLAHFMAMCAVAVQLGEAVRQAVLARGARGSLVAGLSLGGFLTILHHLQFGTANGYVPLLAGPDLAHAFLATPWRRCLATLPRRHPAPVQALLDWRQAFQVSDTRRVRPLLARYDRTMPYAYHAACYADSGVPVVTLERGHMTGSLAFAALRAHVLACLQGLCPLTG